MVLPNKECRIPKDWYLWTVDEMAGWDGWMASPMQWIWTWANFGRWWGASVRPGVLQSMELRRVRHNWATEQQHLNTQTPKGSPVGVYPTPTLTFSHVTVSLSVMFNFFILLLQYKCHRDNKSLFVHQGILHTRTCLMLKMLFWTKLLEFIKKVEHWRIHAFELWCWRRLLRVPWTARGSNQSILKEISPEYSLEGLMLKLKLQYFGHLVWLIWKDPDAEKDWRWEEKGMTEDEMVGWHHWLNGHEFE